MSRVRSILTQPVTVLAAILGALFALTSIRNVVGSKKQPKRAPEPVSPVNEAPQQLAAEPPNTPASSEPDTWTEDEQLEERQLMKRRRFLAWVSLGAGGLSAAIVGVPVIGALISPLVRQPAPEWQPVGAVDQFQVGQTVLVDILNAAPEAWAGPAAKTAAWLRRTSTSEFVAFSIHCTHLGCPVTWKPQAELFLCPCHGGVFYQDGSVAAGPPELPLQQYRVRLNNGQVELQTAALPIT